MGGRPSFLAQRAQIHAGTSLLAFCYGSGHIGFTTASCPEGALPICRGPSDLVRETVSGAARRGQDGKELFVPGIPEAASEIQAMNALQNFTANIGGPVLRHE